MQKYTDKFILLPLACVFIHTRAALQYFTSNLTENCSKYTLIMIYVLQSITKLELYSKEKEPVKFKTVASTVKGSTIIQPLC